MKKRVKQIIFWVAIVLILLVAAWYSLFFFNFTPASENTYGVSFASAQAEYLGFDAKEVYSALLDDLGVKNLRISVYWNRLQPQKDKYDFSELDWQMDQAQKHNASVILAIGRRVPRWPECHSPTWAKNLSKQEEENALLSYLETVVLHYKNRPALRIWQVENEPFLDLFGECPRHDKKLLKKEINLVEKLDPNHPTMVTDSGEFGTWARTHGLGEYLGTSIYRIVAEWWSGYVKYGGFIPPAFYPIKAWLVQKPMDQIIISELQAEPWTRKELLKTSIQEQFKSMSLKQFKKNIVFAQRTGFTEIYFWGAEWWYWMKSQDHPEFWEEARKLFMH
ncbi:MAG: beta-galactosidase [Candidatus Berkelbacteria bacterium]|nr:beta-galactosidase [Candidatus Berkelbacteria bacterium]